MIRNDFRNTYKSFLVVLCGWFLAATAGNNFGLALGIGLLFYFAFLMRLLNVLLCDAIFDSEGNIIEPRVPWKRLICNKIAVLLSYSAIGEAVFFIISLLMKEYDVLEYGLPYLTAMAAVDSQSLFAVDGTILYRIVAWIIPALSLLVIMLACNVLALKRPRAAVWCIFWVLNLFIVPYLILPCLKQGLSLIMNSILAEKAAALSLGAGYLFMIYGFVKSSGRR